MSSLSKTIEGWIEGLKRRAKSVGPTKYTVWTLLIFVLIFPVAIPLGLPITMSPSTVSFYDAIEALKPGDILRAMNGKTIDVVNTDAEGRLILADALCYAQKLGLSPLVDVATLTGACRIALGDIYTAVLGNNQKLVDKIVKAGADAGERLWQLPADDEYKELNKGDVADIKNSGGRWGGTITAAMFLSEFVTDTPWAHLDIAGTSRTEKIRSYFIKGATGVAVRTLVNLAIMLSTDDQL